MASDDDDVDGFKLNTYLMQMETVLKYHLVLFPLVTVLLLLLFTLSLLFCLTSVGVVVVFVFATLVEMVESVGFGWSFPTSVPASSSRLNEILKTDLVVGVGVHGCFLPMSLVFTKF